MNRPITTEMIEKWIRSEDPTVRLVAIKACYGREVPIRIIKKGLKDEDLFVKIGAERACQGKDIPLKNIQKWFKSKDYIVRAAAIEGCAAKDKPLEIIENGLKDKNWEVCDVAARVWTVRTGEPLPYTRTIEPPERVYYPCLNGVVVMASIPEDAEIRGNYGGLCRANKAKILEVIGDFGGEEVGIIMQDKPVACYAGDEVFFENFDRGFNPCGFGFSFYCEIERVKYCLE